jgi:hypothetical protein
VVDYQALFGSCEPLASRRGCTSHVLQVLIIDYCQYECCNVTHRALPIELQSESPDAIKPQSRLITKCNAACTYGLIAVNSCNKFYCQLFIISLNIRSGIIQKRCVGHLLRPLNFLTKEDSLPEDELGRTSMLVVDIAWLREDTQAAVLFSAGYICVVSVLGYALTITEFLSGVPKHFVTITRTAIQPNDCPQHVALICIQVRVWS